MSLLKLLEAEVIDKDTEANYAFISTLKETTGLHSHDFYEFFLVTKGKMRHNVNEIEQILSEGALVFVRPEDAHYYLAYEDFQCSFINLAFSKSLINSLFCYLGDSFPAEIFLNAQYPPVVHLSSSDKEILKVKLEALNLISLKDKSAKRVELRTLVAELFTRYMLQKTFEPKEHMPEWLADLCSRMRQPEHFIKGVDAMTALSGKTHEHICREMKKYLKQTPTQWINHLRLEYAANLIFNTDLTIIAVSMESGFNNLSHFNHVFRDKFLMSPSAFRKVAMKNTIY